MASGQKKVQFFSDFTGGLNLQTEIQNLRLNEVAAVWDIDFNPRGGFRVRNGLNYVVRNSGIFKGTGFYDNTGAYILGQVSLGTDCIIGVSAQQGTTDRLLWSWDGASLTYYSHVVTDNSSVNNDSFVRYATWNSKLYLANCWSSGSLRALRRTGSAFATQTVLTNSWNNDYTAPAGGNMPLARLVANHQGHMWVADTVESATRYRHRVRFSHPLQGEDWAEADYFDIDNSDASDQITALIPFRDMLLVFKRRSVYAVFGYDRDSFVVERVSGAAGAAGPEAVDVSENGVYWWSSDGDVMFFDGSRITGLGERIKTATTYWNSLASTVRVCWAEGRVWVTWTSNGASDCFVFDPAIGKQGAWTRYSAGITSLCWYRRVDTYNPNSIFCLSDVSTASTEFLYDINSETKEADDIGTISVGVPAEVEIVGELRTSWFTGNDTALKKSFKRLNVTAAAKEPCELMVDVYLDYNTNQVTKTLTMPFTIDAAGTLWGTGVWGTNTWGDAGSQYLFDRLQSVGRGRAVQFVFRMENNQSRWWVDSFTLPYIEKFYR